MINIPDEQGITSGESEKEDTEEKKYIRQIKRNHTKSVHNNVNNTEELQKQVDESIKKRI